MNRYLEEVTVWSPSVRDEMFSDLVKSIKPFHVRRIPQDAGKNFSELCNFAINNTDSHYIIIANDKARPTCEDVERLTSLLQTGYGFVGFYRFGFFGMDAEFARRLGGFDTRFIDSGYEDNDFLIRLKQSNVKIYVSEEIEYLDSITSLWSQKRSAVFFQEKYQIDHRNKRILQMIPHQQEFLETDFQKFSKGDFLDSTMCTVPLVQKSVDFSETLFNYEIIQNF